MSSAATSIRTALTLMSIAFAKLTLKPSLSHATPSLNADASLRRENVLPCISDPIARAPIRFFAMESNDVRVDKKTALF
jgi:hypothetical protein